MNARKALAYVAAGAITLLLHVPTLDLLNDYAAPWVFASGASTFCVGVILMNTLMKEARKRREAARAAANAEKID